MMNNRPIYPKKDDQTEKLQGTNKSVPLIFLYVLTIGSYYLGAQIGSFLTIPGTNIGYIWPPVGIALALMLLFGYRIWPAIALAAFITDLPFLITNFPLKTALFVASGQTFADVLEIVLSVYILNKISKDQQFFSRAGGVLKFLLAVCISQIISAIINIASLYLGENILLANFGDILWSYWISNVVSILLLSPLILIWVRNRNTSLKLGLVYHAIFYLLTIAATLLIFSFHTPGRNDYFEYFTFLFVICAAFVLGQTGVTMVIAIVATITLWTTSAGSGPFLYTTSNDSLLTLEIYLATLSISGLVVSSVLLEQRHSESSLRESEHLYRTLVETLPEGIAVSDLHGKITFVSDQLLAIYGSENAQEAANSSMFDWIAPESREKAQTNIQKLYNNDLLKDIEYTLLRRDGSTFIGEITGSILKNEEGQPTGMVTIHRDITERKFAEAILYRQVTFDKMLTGILNRFASSPQSDIDRCVRTGLQEIATFIGANQAYISMISTDRKSWGITHEWHARELIGINTTATRIPFGTRPWAESRLLSREMVNIKTLTDFPPDANEDRKQAEIEGVKSILSIPMSSMDENVTGSVTLRSHGINKIWTEKDVDRFKMVVDTIASILERKQAQVALTQESELNASMAEHSQQLLGSDSIQEIVDITLKKALALSGSKYGVIGYIDPQTGILVYPPFTGGMLDEFSSLEHEAALKNLISLSSDALKNRQTLLKNQLSGVEAGSSKANMGQVIINKILSVPGMHGNVLVGHIALANPEKDYNENDLLKIERLASIFALGIRHKQAEEEVRRLNMELEQRVLERTKELEAANKELESFSYSISHDLRAPLRAIEGLSRIAEDEFGASAPPEAARLITAIRSNTLRMGQLIDDLLRFSRLTRLPIKKELVNHNRLVVDALQTLTDQQIGRQIEIIILSLPDCQGDPSLLLQVWINLISNALKFTRKNNYAKLEIGFKMDEHSRPAYYVNDNGVGFDMKYAGKLFGVFQRLHNEKDFDGTGVGLALVSRIINRHGGNIWAESAPNAGATFYFTL